MRKTRIHVSFIGSSATASAGNIFSVLNNDKKYFSANISVSPWCSSTKTLVPPPHPFFLMATVQHIQKRKNCFATRSSYIVSSTLNFGKSRRIWEATQKYRGSTMESTTTFSLYYWELNTQFLSVLTSNRLYLFKTADFWLPTTKMYSKKTFILPIVSSTSFQTSPALF